MRVGPRVASTVGRGVSVGSSPSPVGLGPVVALGSVDGVVDGAGVRDGTGVRVSTGVGVCEAGTVAVSVGAGVCVTSRVQPMHSRGGAVRVFSRLPKRLSIGDVAVFSLHSTRPWFGRAPVCQASASVVTSNSFRPALASMLGDA